MQHSDGTHRDQTGEITTLSSTECWELVNAATVGRLGFRHGEDVQIIPVNYQVESGVIIRTSSTGILADLPGGPRVAFQVDYHSSAGAGWSILMHGTLSVLTDEEAQTLQSRTRVLPWAGGERDLLLRFEADDISGRRVRRTRNR
jgi:nitroimidazol reductase NimA-like FMN-containing flavoprotein (pyridoxamine 5'-phosphate oxidase superfamily)